MDNTNPRPIGPTIGLIVILIIIVLGGIYFWQSRATSPADNSYNTTENQPDDINRIETQSSSDDTTAIGGDLNAYGESDINNVDSDL